MLYRIYFTSVLLFTSLRLIAEPTLEDLFSSKDEQIVSLTNPSDFLIAGLVHPLSGQISLQETDLIARGAQNITLERTFIPQYTPLNESGGVVHPSKKSYGGWVYFPQIHLTTFTTLKYAPGITKVPEVVVCVSDANGTILPYRLIDPIFRGLPAAPGIFFSNQQIKKHFFWLKDYHTFFLSEGCIYERRGVFQQRPGPSWHCFSNV